MFKRLGALVMSVMMLGSSMAAAAAADVNLEGYPSQKGYDPETVMWTDNPIENVLAETGIYGNAAEVNPNADSKSNVSMQNPYAANGDKFTGWAYSEFCWTNSYPIGNGRMAGMVAGGIDKEVIQINEDTCWDGSPYGTLKDENGNTLTKISQTANAEKISVENPTSGSIKDDWKYFRGANADGTPAEIGSADAIVGDETFRTKFPDFANKSISYQSLNIDNSKEQQAVQDRWSMERMVEETFLGSPNRQRAYKSFVEVYLDFGQHHEQAENYVKRLDMKTGVVTVEYDYHGEHYKRESFASYPDQVVATHVESTEELNFLAELHTYHNQKTDYYKYEKISDNEVKLTASVYNGSKDDNEPGTVNAIRFESRMFLDGDKDTRFAVAKDNTSVSVVGGNSADIYVVGATNYVDYLNLDNTKPGKDCDKYSANVKKRTYPEIKARHIADFKEQFDKTDLTIQNDTEYADEYSNTPTEKRIRKDVDGKSGFLTGADSSLEKANANGVYSTYSEGDNQLATLDFNYGKYLIISGSRAGREATGSDEIDIPESQPLNLTGKWNAALSASWNGKYTININTEMNYWAAQPLGLDVCEQPLIDTFDDLAQSGSITAAYQYGITNDRGDDQYKPGDPWVMHHNYDLWRGTQPIDNATAGLWPTGGVWLLDHAWQYYNFNKDTEYLAEVYPYMVGAAKFFTQFLVVDPKTGYLVTAASCSPEQGGVQPGPAMDTQLVRNLYDMVQKASEILGKTSENAELLAKINEQMPSSYLADEKGKIAPNIIDDAGLIREWVRGDVSFDISSGNATWQVINPFTNEKTGVYAHTASNNGSHRHCSSLWEMYPGTHLSAYSENENEQKIFKAFQDSTTARGAGSGQGWGVAWRISLNARALYGDTSSKMLEQLFTTRTSPNLFDQHPNFQIDGNYGITAGVIEMLIQSHDGTINLLPAIPERWKTGSFKGFNTREGATVDLKWDNNVPREAVIHAKENKEMKIRSEYAANAEIFDANGNKVEAKLSSDNTLLSFTAAEGQDYTIKNFGNELNPTSVPEPTEQPIKGSPVPSNTPEPTLAPNVPHVYDINASYYENDKLCVDVTYNGTESEPKAKVLIGTYESQNQEELINSSEYDITGSNRYEFDYAKPQDGQFVKIYVWDGTNSITPLSGVGTIGEKPVPTIEPTNAPTDNPVPTTDPARTITVDGSKESEPAAGTYKTIREAVAAVSANPPSNEESRIYINVVPGTYREQVVINVPYITLQKQPNSQGEVKLTWYYGTNTLYDSCDESGYYNPDVIDGGVTKNAPKDWGPALVVKENGDNFACEGLYLENSFNEYYTQEELNEYMAPAEGSFDRGAWLNEQLNNGVDDETINSWIQSRSPIIKDTKPSLRERAAAINTKADRIVFKNCTIMSKQDTMGINNDRIYFENCKIGGTVDYICGSATAVFNNCELYWNAGPIKETSKSTDTDSGYITAPSQSTQKGYVFYNCKVTGSETATAGAFGRPWNPNGEAIYINTKIGTSSRPGYNAKSLISESGWATMSDNPPENARFGEFGSTDIKGYPIQISGDLRQSKLLDEWTMLEYNPYSYTCGTDGWDPSGTAEDYKSVNSVAEATNVEIPEGTSTEVVLPSAPNGYEFSWASESEYAVVSEDGTKIIVTRPASGEKPIETEIILYVRNADANAIGTKAVIPVTINPTTDKENVFEVNGTVTSTSGAPETDIPISVKLYKGKAVIKTASAIIKAGTTSASYKADGIPVGDYKLVIDAESSDYKVTVPADGTVEISGAKGDIKTVDSSVGKLTHTVLNITTDPTAIGSGASVVNNNGSYTVSSPSGTSDGAYWNLSKLAEGVKTSDSVTVSYTVTFSADKPYKQDDMGCMIDVLSGIPGTLNKNANPIRINRVNMGRWDQMNMLDFAQASRSGSQDTEHQWLKCAGTNIAKNSYKPQSVKVVTDFKNRVMTASAKVTEAASWNDYTFTGFPEEADVDRENMCLAVYPGSAGANNYVISDITVEFTEFK